MMSQRTFSWTLLAAVIALAGCAVPDVSYREDVADPKGGYRGNEFVRYSGYDNVAGTLEIAGTTYSNPKYKSKLTLLGAVHIGDLEYYQALQERMDEAGVVFFELVAPAGFDHKQFEPQAGGMYGEIADVMGLAEQMAELEYRGDNMRWLDMEAEEFSRRINALVENAVQKFSKELGREHGWAVFKQALAQAPDEVKAAYVAWAAQTLAAHGGTTEAMANPVLELIQFIYKVVVIPLKAEKEYYAMFKTEKAFEDKYQHTLAAGLNEQSDVAGQMAPMKGQNALTDIVIEAIEGFWRILIEDRNDVVVDGLHAFLVEKKEGEKKQKLPKDIVIFYGAGHFENMAVKLAEHGWAATGDKRWYEGISIRKFE